MNLRTGGDGRITQLSRYERDTMVFVCGKGTHGVILFLEILFSFNKFNHCGKQGQGFVVEHVCWLWPCSDRDYIIHQAFCFFMVKATLIELRPF